MILIYYSPVVDMLFECRQEFYGLNGQFNYAKYMNDGCVLFSDYDRGLIKALCMVRIGEL